MRPADLCHAHRDKHPRSRNRISHHNSYTALLKGLPGDRVKMTSSALRIEGKCLVSPLEEVAACREAAINQELALPSLLQADHWNRKGSALVYFGSSVAPGRILVDHTWTPESLLFHSWTPMRLLDLPYHLSACASPGAHLVNTADQFRYPLPVRHCMSAFSSFENPRSSLAQHQGNHMRQQILREPGNLGWRTNHSG